MKRYKNITDHRLAKALAHPIRMRILSVLGEREASPSELSDELEVPLGNIAYHVRILLSLELIELVRTTAVRGSVMHHYTAVAQPQFSDEVWGALPDGIKQTTLGTLFSQAGEDLRSAMQSGGFSRVGTHASRTPLMLDREGWSRLAEAGNNFLAQVDEIGNDSRQRIEAGGEKGEPAMALVVLFDTPHTADSIGSTSVNGNGSAEVATESDDGLGANPFAGDAQGNSSKITTPV